MIDNRGGAGGNIAHQFAANGPTDGSTILFGSVGPLTIAPHMMKLPYDPVKDLSPITMGVNFPNVLVVHAGTGIKTFAEYIAYAKKNPKKLDYASTGPGSASHLAGELLDDMAGIDTVHVPYKGVHLLCKTCWVVVSRLTSRLTPPHRPTSKRASSFLWPARAHNA